ncbi:MAG: peptidyl-prolyl cis-trans isomerase [Syntrophorhabdales bacterium]|jgi:peptidyl-prolyl cis-trans isomerase C
MKKYLIFLFLLLPLLACSKKQEGKTIVTIDGDRITEQEFNSELDKIPMNMKMLVASQSGKRNFLDRLIVQKLLLREAKKENVEKDKEFQDRLAEFREQLIMQTLLSKKVGAGSKFTDEELQKYYDAHKEEFKKEREIQTRQIVVKTEQEAKELQAKIAKGEDFTELAKRYSLDPSARANGGDIGYHPKGTLIPQYEEAAFKLTKVGEVSPPVKTQLGYHIIQLEGVKPPAYVSFAEVKDFIRQKMTQEKQTEVVQKYVEDLKKNAKIVVNEDLLKEEGKQGEAPSKASVGVKTEPVAKPEPEAKDKAGAQGQENAPAKPDAGVTK